jgi:hypothetical protein
LAFKKGENMVGGIVAFIIVAVILAHGFVGPEDKGIRIGHVLMAALFLGIFLVFWG